MKSFLLLLLLNLCAVMAFAQIDPPPAAKNQPPQIAVEKQGICALIYSAPLKQEIKKFTSLEFGFSIDFVGTPEVTVKEASYGTVTIFSTNRSGSNAVVKVYNMILKDGENLKAEDIYEFFKKDYLRYPTAKLVSENDFKIGTFTGKEISLTVDINFYKFRVLVVENRVYEIYISATNWEILNKSRKDAKDAFEKETARFFDSFKLTNK